MEKTIAVTCGTGKGGTTLAAFDSALFSAGIANHNLIPLSSVIPEGFVLVVEKTDLNYAGGFGDKMYVVMAEKRETRKGHGAWAGLGWAMAETNPSKGLFVEHKAESEEEVTTMIHKSLASMTAYRKEKYGAIQHKIAGIVCEEEPVCAVVAAIYETEGWKNPARS